MALSKKTQEELPFPIEGIDEQPTSEQISFDDLEFEAETVDEEELKPKQYFTISGKVQQYEPDWEHFGVNELDVGAEMEGIPEITRFEKKDKSYDAFRLRVMDDGEILDCYFNFPKKDYPYVKNINKGFDFYKPCFNFIFAVLKWRDERNVVDKNGDEVNNFKSVNIETFAKYVDQMNHIGVRIIEGNNGYNDWIIYKME